MPTLNLDPAVDVNPWSDASSSTSAPTPPPPPPRVAAQGTSRGDAIDVDSSSPLPSTFASASAFPSTSSSTHPIPPAPTEAQDPHSMLLLVFIHGFKGSSDTTFEDFPSRLVHLLSETYRHLAVHSLVYPTYDTRGSLAAAVDTFVEWLTMQCVSLESKPPLDSDTGEPNPHSGRGKGMGSVKIVLAGHSMGGLVAVDAALSIVQNSGKHEVWPRIVSVIAFDTPYYGVHPGVFKNGFNKYAGYVQTAQTIGTFFAPMGVGLAARWNAARNQPEHSNVATRAGSDSSSGSGSRAAWAPPAAAAAQGTRTSAWSNWFGHSNPVQPSTASEANSQNAAQPSNSGREGSGGGGSTWRTALMATGALALAGGAAASAAYFNKDKIGGAYGWVSDHLLFVSNLWDDRALRKRLDDLVSQPQILFHCYYNRLPARRNTASSAPTHERTFVILPPKDAESASFFTPMDNAKAIDEVEAHISMFSAKNNPLYFDLGLRTANLIGLCLDNEARYGNQIRSQDETRERGADGEIDEEKGLRFGDDDITRMQAENDQEIRRRTQAAAEV
ncbi:hypothetical protein ACQY0O_007351 [Thecaphora frezii]